MRNMVTVSFQGTPETDEDRERRVVFKTPSPTSTQGSGSQELEAFPGTVSFIKKILEPLPGNEAFFELPCWSKTIRQVGAGSDENKLIIYK